MRGSLIICAAGGFITVEFLPPAPSGCLLGNPMDAGAYMAKRARSVVEGAAVGGLFSFRTDTEAMSAFGPKRTSLVAPHGPLSGVKRTRLIAAPMSAYDPKLTCASAIERVSDMSAD